MRHYKNARICENNRLETATVTAPEDVSFPFVNSFDLINRGKVYKPGSLSFTIEADLGVNANITFFSILGTSSESLTISDDAVITLKASDINLFDGSEPINVTVDVNELGIYYNFADENNPDGVQYRYWQVVIDDSLNYQPIEIAYMYLGDHVVLHRNIANGFQVSTLDNSIIARSDSGKVFARRRPDYTQIDGVSMTIMTLEDRNKLLTATRKLRRDVPFLFVIDPTECIESYDFAVRPMYFTRPPNFRHVVRDRYSSSFSMREVV